MTPVPPKTITDALHWRYATKKFDHGRRIPAETWSALEEALILTPSSYGLQPWKFIVVSDHATRERLVPASWDQKQAIECSHYVVFAARRNYDDADLAHFMERSAEVRGVPIETFKGYAAIIAASTAKARANGTLDAWMAKQSYIALGQFMAAAALLGVDTCPMEGINPHSYDEILGLTGSGYATLCACAAGYRSVDDKYSRLAKIRFKAEEVVRHI
jgi:nitroreductase